MHVDVVKARVRSKAYVVDSERVAAALLQRRVPRWALGDRRPRRFDRRGAVASDPAASLRG